MYVYMYIRIYMHACMYVHVCMYVCIYMQLFTISSYFTQQQMTQIFKLKMTLAKVRFPMTPTSVTDHTTHPTGGFGDRSLERSEL